MSDTAECELPSFIDFLRPHGEAIEVQARAVCALPAGWDHAGAPAIDRTAVENAVRLALLVTCPECIPATILPARNGNAIVDWTWGDERVEVEVDATGHLDVLVKAEGQYVELVMHLSDQADMAQLAHYVTGVGLGRFAHNND